jgi:glycerol-3-phosphate O-acyltransferase
VVIYLMNHRSNADYVLVAYVMMGDVSISYAVGEWARAFPLEYLFKSFGSYFIRRKFASRCTTPCFSPMCISSRATTSPRHLPEGGLTRDGTLRPAKIGLLDYALSVAADAEVRQRMYVVPVGINYDRVLEDRSLLRELELHADRPVTSRLDQLREVGRFALWNTARLLTGRWRRYGRAAVTIGQPVPIDGWLSSLGFGYRPVHAVLPERLAQVQELQRRADPHRRHRYACRPQEF